MEWKWCSQAGPSQAVDSSRRHRIGSSPNTRRGSLDLSLAQDSVLPPSPRDSDKRTQWCFVPVCGESDPGRAADRRARDWLLFTELLNEHIDKYARRGGFMPLNVACKEGVNLLNLAIKFVKASLKPKLPINKQIIIRQPENGRFFPSSIFSKVDFMHLSPWKPSGEIFPGSAPTSACF